MVSERWWYEIEFEVDHVRPVRRDVFQQKEEEQVAVGSASTMAKIQLLPPLFPSPFPSLSVPSAS